MPKTTRLHLPRQQALLLKLGLTLLIILPFVTPLVVWLTRTFGRAYLWNVLPELVAVAFIFGAGWVASRRPKLARQILAQKLNWLVIGYGLLLAIYIVAGRARPTVLAGAVADGRFLGVFLAAQVLAATSVNTKKLKNVVIGLGLVIALLGIVQVAILPRGFLQHLGYDRPGATTSAIPPAYQMVAGQNSLERAQATLRGPNVLGAYLLVPLSLCLLAGADFARKRWQQVSIVGLLLAGLFLSQSRSAWLGALIIGAIWALRQFKNYRTVLVLLASLGLVMGSALVWQAKGHHLPSLLFHQAASNTGHIAATKQAVRDVAHTPLGHGLGTAGPISALGNQKPRIAENYFLQVAQETGWLSLVLILAIHGAVAWLLWRQRTEPYALALLAALLALSATNALLHTWIDEPVAITWWLLAGYATVLYTNKLKRL